VGSTPRSQFAVEFLPLIGDGGRASASIVFIGGYTVSGRCCSASSRAPRDSRCGARSLLVNCRLLQLRQGHEFDSEWRRSKAPLPHLVA
jgi:hypothetical protein